MTILCGSATLSIMRMTHAFIPTRKEAPSDAEVMSHIYMQRGGYIRWIASGVYSFLPLGYRVIRKIEQIIREEMDNAGCQEVLLPTVLPGSLWKESGRWDHYGKELLRFTDRKGTEYCLGPTHEEAIVSIVRDEIKSYRDLPLNLYQIQGKFRDELRPRAGLMRGREFLMKDAYSFDVSSESAKETYEAMRNAYQKIFKRCGLSFSIVLADSGAIGGSLSHEFHVLAQSGEDTLVSCSECHYAANVETAEIDNTESTENVTCSPEDLRKETVVSKPSENSLSKHIKTLLYHADDELIAVLIRGDHDVNDVALKDILNVASLTVAQPSVLKKTMDLSLDDVGPVGLDIPMIADRALRDGHGMIAGANEANQQYCGISIDRDIATIRTWGNIRCAAHGDRCGHCKQGTFSTTRGIEVGHTFFLGTKYSQPMKCQFLNEEGKSAPVVMGCYGIGITRIAAAAIEQNHDEHGICWPLPIAPYQVALLSLQPNDDEVKATADRIYQDLEARGIEILYDDRKERPGVKFKDADLIGIPIRITVGRRTLDNGQVEFKHRTDKESCLIAQSDIITSVERSLETLRKNS